MKKGVPLDKQVIGMISGALVIISAIPYCIGIWRGRIKPQIISWGLWSFIGLTLLLTYKSSGAENNIWPAVFGFTNPLMITLLAFRQGVNLGKMAKRDWYCLVLSVAAMLIWIPIEDNKNMASLALFLGIIADGFAAIPTIIFVWKNPGEDRPFAWGAYAVAYGLALFAVPEVNFANLVLPIYMLVGASLVALPLVIHRAKNRMPLREWI